MADATGFTGQPVRPYSAPDQLGGNAGRSASFAVGVQGDDSGNTATSLSPDPALNLSSQQFNAMVPKSAGQTSVLQSPLPGLNGMSQDDYNSRVLPGGVTLPSSNGSSQASYEQALYMRLAGRDEG
jgi:hypothetical protein